MKSELVPFLIRHCLAGVAAGWTTVALMLWTDLAGLGTLAAASDLWPIPHLMLFAFFGLTFGSAAMGAAIMGLGGRDAAAPRPHIARRFPVLHAPAASSGSGSRTHRREAKRGRTRTGT